MKEKPEIVYGTLHGEHWGAVFDTYEKAARYPGPRMLECAEKTVVPFYSFHSLEQLVSEWQQRLESIDSGEGARMELDAAIGDLIDLMNTREGD